jgi:hypothetical protein
MIKFIPMSSTGRALTTNPISMSTALLMILTTNFLGKTVSQFGVEEACKVTVKPFVAADKFVAEAKARHESALF